jgi:hypothetical protein
MTLREALQAVYDRNGRLTPEIVVEEARNGTDAVAQALHDRLTWDDEEAAEKFRLIEARTLIRTVKITYRSPQVNETRETRFWVSVPTAAGRGYMPIDEVAADPMLRKIALADAERQWRDLWARHRDKAEFIALVLADVESEEAA